MISSIPLEKSRCFFREKRKAGGHFCQHGKENHIATQLQEGVYRVIDTGIQKFKTDLDNGCIFYA